MPKHDPLLVLQETARALGRLVNEYMDRCQRLTCERDEAQVFHRELTRERDEALARCEELTRELAAERDATARAWLDGFDNGVAAAGGGIGLP